MNKKGFTLIELIAVITLFSIISLLVFGALTGSIRSASVKEMEVYKDNVSRAAQVYVETNLENYTLDSPGKYIVLKGAKIIEAGYLDKSIKNPSSCSIEEVNIRIYMENDYTLSYAVYCDGEEPPLSGDAEPIEPDNPATPDTPETPSQTLYVFEYTGSVQEVTLPAGKWKLEVWGAEGGKSNYNNSVILAGGKGGYSVGILNLTSSTPIYINVGGLGGDATTASAGQPGFNGGGTTINHASRNSGAGGGATDIRISQNSLYSRVIVAGGGGGAGASLSTDYTVLGGVGGGASGGTGIYTSKLSANGTGGTLIGGGNVGTYSETCSTNPTSGSFGIGGSGGLADSWSHSSGGGGWYGGGGAMYTGGAGGGSGWVYTSDNLSAWQTGNPTDAANWLLNSSYYLTNALTIAGNQSFEDPDGTTVTGHTGNGYARITWVSN